MIKCEKLLSVCEGKRISNQHRPWIANKDFAIIWKRISKMCYLCNIEITKRCYHNLETPNIYVSSISEMGLSAQIVVKRKPESKFRWQKWGWSTL